ncbi:hypothetical protein [Flavivirga eckloniae]|uniref:Uncharacterized protein n=1 Tax=Flavivirga eckloniae TaxID=1803846 RepID=A0A2K9PKQ9_9FLAO|nr:hypothetical protein [Flavivirga eckloniae]AUP77644.1 hypothetical protein C1H87_02505 [Flavivirga eckloniae]
MKTVIIIVLILIIFLGYLVFSGKKRIKEDEENIKLLTIENYILLRDSPHADALSKYKILKQEDKLRFTTQNGYTLFWLELHAETPHGVKLRGLDGYGIRDREFLKYTANLIRKITQVK